MNNRVVIGLPARLAKAKRAIATFEERERLLRLLVEDLREASGPVANGDVADKIVEILDATHSEVDHGTRAEGSDGATHLPNAD